MFLILKVRPYITSPMSGNTHHLCLGCARSVRKQTKATAWSSYPLNCSTLLLKPSTCKVVAKGKKLKTTVLLLTCYSRRFFFPDKYRTDWTGNIRLFTTDPLKIALKFPRLCLCLFQTAMSYRLWDAFCYPKSHVSVISLTRAPNAIRLSFENILTLNSSHLHCLWSMTAKLELKPELLKVALPTG